MDDLGGEKRQNLEEKGPTDPDSQEPNTAQLQKLIREYIGVGLDKFQMWKVVQSNYPLADMNNFSETWELMEDKEPMLFQRCYKRKYIDEQHDVSPKTDLPEGVAKTEKRQKVDKGIATSVEQVEDERTSLLGKVAALEDELKKSREELKKLREEFATKYEGLDERTSLLGKVAALEDELKKSREELKKLREGFATKNGELVKKLKDFRDCEERMKIKRRHIFGHLLITVAKAERQEARMRVQNDSLKFGKFRKIGADQEVWEDGQAFTDIAEKLRSLSEMKNKIKKRPSDKDVVTEAEEAVTDKIFKFRRADIEREEQTIKREKERCESEKAILKRDMARIKIEDASRFNTFPLLKDRYVALNLLGKGGFSEVYKGFDFLGVRYVALKFHSLIPGWSDERKITYIRRSEREQSVHTTLNHRHIVRALNTFDVDDSTCCTVLEYCGGNDLGSVLKARLLLPEEEARIIAVQISEGLAYLNKLPKKIIHYDLKPGNVLFDEYGVAKVSDFGLCKIMDAGSEEIVLTSMGVGTCWYLPPECFDESKTPFISSKVDVWSLGVIFYQMLFGRLPFGHNVSRERIIREKIILKALEVHFPPTPSVSDEAKEFIRRCLRYNQADRPEVLAIAQDPYLSYTKT